MGPTEWILIGTCFLSVIVASALVMPISMAIQSRIIRKRLSAIDTALEEVKRGSVVMIQRRSKHAWIDRGLLGDFIIPWETWLMIEGSFASKAMDVNGLEIMVLNQEAKQATPRATPAESPKTLSLPSL